MSLRLLEHLSLAHFLEMETLELQFYDAQYITPAQEAWRWYQRHPNTTIAAEMNGRIAGFINLFPVQPAVYAALRRGEFNDHFMELEHVADTAQLPLHLFLSCILVTREARPLGTARQLLRAAALLYAGLPCVGVVTDNVTADGVRFSERYGFTRLCRSDHHSWVYEQGWEPFLRQLEII